MKKYNIILISFLAIGCQSEKFKDVGNIPYNKDIDSSEFVICDEDLIKEYYVRRSSDTPPNYLGEKRGMEKEILKAYSKPDDLDQDGYITIRFIVNCKGETGRFRIEEMDNNFKPMKFDERITNQLFLIVKELSGWVPRSNGDKSFDFYQYLTFKIQNGHINKILP